MGSKNILQKISFFKDYSSLVVPIVIVLIAVLVFIPTQLMSGKLKAKIANESITTRGNKVKSLSKNAVARNQWEAEQEYQRAYERDANRTALIAAQSTERELLSYTIFPGPKDTSSLIFDEFGRQFRDAEDGLIARINARDCPTDAELKRSVSSLGSRGGWSSGRSSIGAYSRSSEVDATIKDVLCQEKAKSASVYCNPSNLSGYEFWKEYKYAGVDEAVKDCWYWQLAYWMTEDVFDTVETLNYGSNSVLTSPVKRIMAIGFVPESGTKFTKLMSRPRAGSRTSRKTAKVANDRPSYVLSPEDWLTESCMGRLCNDDTDVVHFNVVVVVSTKAVLHFMQELCSAKQHKFKGWSGNGQEQIFKHNQITILKSDIEPIDREEQTHSLYRYGEDAVVKLDLICEYTFNKNGYDEIKPASVKETLKKPEERKPVTKPVIRPAPAKKTGEKPVRKTKGKALDKLLDM